MRLTRIELRNVGPARNVDWHLEAGLIGLYGSNGAGKSTSIDSVYAVLTGDYSRHAEGKSGFITRGSKKGVVSFGRVTAVAGQHTFCVERHFSSAKASLTIDGVEVCNTPETVSLELQQRLGVDAQVLKNYVFVSQLGLLQFVSQTPTERAKSLAHLCGTLVADELLDDFKVRLAIDEDKAKGFVDTYDEAVVEKRQAKTEKETCRAALLEAKKSKPSVEDVETATALVARSREYAQLVADAEERKVTWLVDKKQLLRDRKSHAKALSLLEDLATKWIKKHRTVAAVKEALKASKAEQAKLQLVEGRRRDQACVAETIKKLKRELRRSDHDLSSLNASCNDIEQKLRESLHQQQVFTHRVKAAKKGAEFDCGECGTHHSALDLEVEQAQLRQHTTAATAYHEQLQRVREKIDKLTTATRRLAEAEQTLADIDNSLAELKFDEKKASQLRELSNKYLNIRRTQQAWRQAKRDLQVAATLLADKEERCKKSRQRYKAALSKADAAFVPSAEVEKASEFIRASTGLLEAYYAAKSAYKTAAKHYSEKAAAVKVAKVARDKHRKLVDVWLPRLRKAVQLLRPAGLPQEVHRAALTSLAPIINRWLTSFGTPYVIEVHPKDLNYQFYQAGSAIPAPVQTLSGGQKVLCSVGLFAAVKERFASDIKCAVLDEPTAWLDKENVSYLSAALRKLAQSLRIDGGQIIVITHEKSLHRVFDQIITL